MCLLRDLWDSYYPQSGTQSSGGNQIGFCEGRKAWPVRYSVAALRSAQKAIFGAKPDTGLTQVLEQKRTLRTGRSVFIIIKELSQLLESRRVPQRSHLAFEDRVRYREVVPAEHVEVPAS